MHARSGGWREEQHLPRPNCTLTQGDPLGREEGGGEGGRVLCGGVWSISGSEGGDKWNVKQNGGVVKNNSNNGKINLPFPVNSDLASDPGSIDL